MTLSWESKTFLKIFLQSKNKASLQLKVYNSYNKRITHGKVDEQHYELFQFKEHRIFHYLVFNVSALNSYTKIASAMHGPHRSEK